MNVFLIMCHKNAHQVIRLASNLISANSQIIIHADINMPEEEYGLLKDFAHSVRIVHLTDKRFHGILDTRSLVDIAMEMVGKARTLEQEERIHFKYYALLSGQDYLIKPLSFIETELDSSYPNAFIDCTPYDKNNWVFQKSTALCRYHAWINHINKRWVRGIFRLWERVAYPCLHSLGIESFTKLKKMNISLWGGGGMVDITRYDNGIYMVRVQSNEAVCKSVA